MCSPPEFYVFKDWSLFLWDFLGKECKSPLDFKDCNFSLIFPSGICSRTAFQTLVGRITYLYNTIVCVAIFLKSPCCTTQNCCEFHVMHFAIYSGNRRGRSHASCFYSVLETAFKFGGACIMINKRSWEHFYKAFQSIVSPVEYN